MNKKTRNNFILHNASQLLTLAGGPQRGSRLGELGILENSAVAVRDGVIIAVGEFGDLQRDFPSFSQHALP